MAEPPATGTLPMSLVWQTALCLCLHHIKATSASVDFDPHLGGSMYPSWSSQAAASAKASTAAAVLLCRRASLQATAAAAAEVAAAVACMTACVALAHVPPSHPSSITSCGLCHSVPKCHSKAGCPSPIAQQQGHTHRAVTSCRKMCASVLYADAYRPGGGPGRVRGSEGTDLTAACRGTVGGGQSMHRAG